MQTLLGLLYTILFLVYIIAALFVVFHLGRYSLNKRSGFLGIVLFLIVGVSLLIINALLFFSLPFEQLFLT